MIYSPDLPYYNREWANSTVLDAINTMILDNKFDATKDFDFHMYNDTAKLFHDEKITWGTLDAKATEEYVFIATDLIVKFPDLEK